VICIDEAQNLVQRLSPMVIAEHFSMDQRVPIVQIRGKLDFRVLCVARANETADKPDNDYVPDGGYSHSRMLFPKRNFLAPRHTRHSNNCCGQNNERRRLPITMALHADFSQFVMHGAKPKQRCTITRRM
jgi:hypothetical protein